MLIIVQSIVIAGLVWLWRSAPPLTDVNTEQSIAVPSLSPVKTHEAVVKQIDDLSGMRLSRVAQLIIDEEGVRYRPYLDSGGQVTIGIGRNLTGNGISVAELHAIVDGVDYVHILAQAQVKNGRVYISSIESAERIFPQRLTRHDVTLLLTDDLNNVRKEAAQVFGSAWSRIGAVRREVIVNVLYNLGLTRFRQFKKFIAAVKENRWHEAAAELLLSEAARQNIARYHRDATVLQTNDERYYR